MKELYVHFNFNVRVEVEDIDDVKDEIVDGGLVKLNYLIMR